MPFRANSIERVIGSPIWRKMYNYFAPNQEVFLEHYHQRSNIESAFFMIKSKFGSLERSKTETTCINRNLIESVLP